MGMKNKQSLLKLSKVYGKWKFCMIFKAKWQNFSILTFDLGGLSQQTISIMIKISVISQFCHLSAAKWFIGQQY